MRPTVSDPFQGTSEILRRDVLLSERDASLDLPANELQHRIRNLFADGNIPQYLKSATDKRC